MQIGLLDIPPEIREMIFKHRIPHGQTMLYTRRKDCAGKNFSAICTVWPQIKDELGALVYKTFGAFVQVVPDWKMQIPRNIHWDRFQWIKTEIMHYRDDQPSKWAGMKELIRSMRHGQPKSLPAISIAFYRESRFDAKWNQDMPARSTYHWRTGWSRYSYASDDEYDNEDEDWLQTTRDKFGNPVPIATEILVHFVDIPACKTAFVKPRGFLAVRRLALPRHDQKARIWDGEYIQDLCGALTLWLSGDRKDIGLPHGLSEDGEPRLEQMAYQKREGRWYWRDGWEYKKLHPELR